jgi:hypothetical protein
MTSVESPKRASRKNGSAPRTPDDALREVEHWLAAELMWTAKLEERTAQRDDLKRSAGQRLVSAKPDEADDMSKGLGVAIAALEAEIANIDLAIEATRNARREAIPHVWQAQAAQLREQAAGIEAEAEAAQHLTRAPLAELERVTGCRYVPESAVTLTELRLTRTGQTPDVVTILVPRFDQLREQAAAIRAQADQLVGPHGPKVRRDGYVTTTKPEELIALATADPMVMAPRIAPDLKVWVDAMVASERGRRSKLADGDLRQDIPTYYELTWRDEQIVKGESRARPAQLQSEDMRTGERVWG